MREPCATAATAATAAAEPVPIDILDKDDGSGGKIATDFKFGTENNSLVFIIVLNNHIILTHLDLLHQLK